MNRLCGRLILSRAKDVLRPPLRPSFRRPPNRYHHMNPMRAALLITGGCGAGIYYYKHLETVPYTNRTRFVLYSPTTERYLADLLDLKSGFEEDEILLSPAHPNSVRVRRILNRIVHAARRRGNSVLPDLFDWEAIVVKGGDRQAGTCCCFLGGKIIIYTRIFETDRTDEEIAYMISRQVGRAIARHHEESITRDLMFRIPYIILLRPFRFYKLLLTEMVSKLLIHCPSSRRQVTEADYIGLLLLASAGYDPRIVSKIFDEQEQSKTVFYEQITRYFSGHPSHYERSQLASQAMEEALAVYQKSISADNFMEVWLRKIQETFDFLQSLIVYFFSPE